MKNVNIFLKFNLKRFESRIFVLRLNNYEVDGLTSFLLFCLILKSILPNNF